MTDARHDETGLEQLRLELERQKRDPIGKGSTFADAGRKMREAQQLCLNVAELLLRND